MKRIARWILGLLVLALVAIQAVPVERTNPPVESDLAAPEPVRAVLRRACYDCHSHETAWPWYSRVAPVSWLVADDVREGRHEVNFSRWGRLDARKQAEVRREAWKEISEGEMPLWFYRPLHPDARLSEEDKAVLRAWLTGPGEEASSDEE
ncbi:MAG: heme-binding domain-containing protein [Candidatus Eisenbacteria bacterium]|nr:heme-binding domain-containing protein [Candidatus Eisenbacteria bacterium]